MIPKRFFFKQLRLFMLVTIVLSITFNVSTFLGTASPSSYYYYKFTVDKEGSTNVEVNFSSTDASGSSWVIVPKFSSWNYVVTIGSITQSENVSTVDVGLEDLYFYQAFKFSFKATTGSFAMIISFDFQSGALIVESRGIFFSPQIGYKQDSWTSGKAEVLFNSHLTVKQSKAIAIGTRSYTPTEIGPQGALFNIARNEALLRLQVEFTTSLTTQSAKLTSESEVFTFESPNKYAGYALNILDLYDRVYGNYSRLFNVTLTPPVGVQFFLPNFDEFLSIGGFTPFSQTGAGTININIFFIRAVNGTIEVIAAHELVHHFLIKAGLSPNYFLWFHEGMSQYVSVTLVERLGFEGAEQEKDRLEQSASELIRLLGGEKFGFLQNWSPSSSPTNVGNYYVASYFVVSRLAQDYGGLDYYERFFERIHGVNVENIDTLTLYLSETAKAHVALKLQEWGFNVFDLYDPQIREKIIETQRAIAAVSPVFQPYKFLAEFFLRQALLSFRRGDMESGTRSLQIAMIMADWAPLLTLLTIAAILGIVVYVLYRRSEKAKLKPPVPAVPPPPPEIFPKSAE